VVGEVGVDYEQYVAVFECFGCGVVADQFGLVYFVVVVVFEFFFCF